MSSPFEKYRKITLLEQVEKKKLHEEQEGDQLRQYQEHIQNHHQIIRLLGQFDPEPIILDYLESTGSKQNIYNIRQFQFYRNTLPPPSKPFLQIPQNNILVGLLCNAETPLNHVISRIASLTPDNLYKLDELPICSIDNYLRYLHLLHSKPKPAPTAPTATLSQVVWDISVGKQSSGFDREWPEIYHPMFRRIAISPHCLSVYDWSNFSDVNYSIKTEGIEPNEENLISLLLKAGEPRLD